MVVFELLTSCLSEMLNSGLQRVNQIVLNQIINTHDLKCKLPATVGSTVEEQLR